MVINGQYQVLKILFQLSENPIVHIDNMQKSASAGENWWKDLWFSLGMSWAFSSFVSVWLAVKKNDFSCQLAWDVGCKPLHIQKGWRFDSSVLLGFGRESCSFSQLTLEKWHIVKLDCLFHCNAMLKAFKQCIQITADYIILQVVNKTCTLIHTLLKLLLLWLLPR